MTLSYYDHEGRAPARTSLLRILITIDLAFVALVLCGWTVLSFWVVDPIVWATWAPLTVGVTPGIFERPFILIWAVPLAGTGCGWLAMKSGYRSVGEGVTLAPVLFILITFAWFYLTPIEWH